MTTINVYLNFDGNCLEAFEFYKSVFGGEFSYLGYYKDMPPSPDGKAMDPAMGEKIMHVALPVSKETMLMGSDTGSEWASSFLQGNNFSISIMPDTKAEADRLFNSLSAGGRVNMPLTNTFWGDYFGMLTDKFGINWMMNFNDGSQNKPKE
jgi:PhnB protein